MFFTSQECIWRYDKGRRKQCPLSRPDSSTTPSKSAHDYSLIALQCQGIKYGALNMILLPSSLPCTFCAHHSIIQATHRIRAHLLTATQSKQTLHPSTQHQKNPLTNNQSLMPFASLQRSTRLSARPYRQSFAATRGMSRIMSATAPCSTRCTSPANRPPPPPPPKIVRHTCINYPQSPISTTESSIEKHVYTGGPCKVFASRRWGRLW